MLLKHTFFILVGMGALGVILFAISPSYANPASPITTGATSISLPSSQETISAASSESKKDSPFSDINLSAQSAFVYDVKNRSSLFEFHSEDSLPLASITKIMTILVALSYIRNPDYTVTITADDLATQGDSGLVLGERWRLSDLAAFTLITSSNDGAVALARSASIETKKSFSELSNELAYNIGLAQSYYLNPSGLDESNTTSGAYGSAHDVSLLMAYAIDRFPEIFEQTAKPRASFTSLSGMSHKAENTNATVDTNIGIIASKTGTTDLAGGNLVIAFDAGPSRPIIITVLGGDPTDRFSDVSILAKEAINSLSK